MKSKRTFIIAAFAAALALSAFPHHAAADSTTAPTPDSGAIRKAGGTNLIYIQYVLVGDILVSVLLP